MKTGENKKNKRGMFITIGIMVVIIAVAVFGYNLIGPNSDKNKEFEKQNAKETEELTDKLVGEIEKIDTQGIMDGTGEPDVTAVLPAEEQKIIDQELAKIDDAKKQQVLQALAENYNSILNQQKLEAIGMIENLIAQGKAEWQVLVANGENTPAAKGLKASEYLAKVKIMENNMDASFAAVVAKMDEQLKAQGIDASPIIDKYKADYENIIEENKKVMMDKAISAIKGN